MKFKYSTEVDILLIQLGDGKFDYAEENEGVIVHYNKDNVPVLLEVLDAKQFVLNSLSSIFGEKEVTVA